MNKLAPIINDYFATCNQLGQGEEAYEEYRKKSRILSQKETYVGVSVEDVKEAVWHASVLEWKITDNFYDGYKWKTTHYLYLLRDFCRQGFSQSVRQAFEEKPEKFNAYRSVEVAQALLSHNNTLLADDPQKQSRERTTHQFIKQCLRQGTPHTLAMFSDGLLFEAEIADMVMGEVLHHGTKEDQEKLFYNLSEACFYDCTPFDPCDISCQEKQWADVMAKWLPQADDCCGLLLTASTRFMGEGLGNSERAGLGGFYQRCFQGLGLENVKMWDFGCHEANQSLDVLVEFLPEDIQDFFVNNTHMQGFPFCGAQALRKKVRKEVAGQLQKAQTTFRKF